MSKKNSYFVSIFILLQPFNKSTLAILNNEIITSCKNVLFDFVRNLEGGRDQISFLKYCDFKIYEIFPHYYNLKFQKIKIMN